MIIQTAENLSPAIRSSAIRTGALEKMEEDKKMYLDTMNRFTPIGVKEIKKIRPDMSGGFRMFENGGMDLNGLQGHGMLGDLKYNLMNPMSKEEIMRNLGITDPNQEYEVDWERAGLEGTAKDRIELADKLIPVLKKEHEKLNFKRELLKNRLQEANQELAAYQEAGRGTVGGLGVTGATNLGFESQKFTGGINPGLGNQGPSHLSRTTPKPFPVDNEVIGAGADNLGYSKYPETREDLATRYGIYPGSVPYKDEVDIMHEAEDKFQEIDHWYSTLEAPNEDNLNVLKQFNHRRLNQLQEVYQQKRRELESLQEFQDMASQLDNQSYKNTRKLKKKSKGERNKEKQSYKSRFKEYLHNKDKMRRRGEDQHGIDFDRYECTSPNPKRVIKDYHVEFRELDRVGTDGMTEKQKEKAIKDDPKRFKASRSKSRKHTSLSQEDEEDDLEVVVDWLWHRVNPSYKSHVKKGEIINFLMNEDEIREVFDLTENQIAHAVEAYVTDRPEQMSYDEFSRFLSNNEVLAELTPAKKAEKKRRIKEQKEKERRSRKECLLTEEQLMILKENFEKLDKHGDLVVPRSQLISSIQNDVRMRKYLDRGVVYIPSVNKEIAMRKVLHQIEQEEFLKADRLDIGGEDFMSTKSVSNVDLEFKRDEIDDQNVVEVPKPLIEKMKEAYNEKKLDNGYVKTIEFLDHMMNDKAIRDYFDSPVRAEARYGSLPAENFEEVLNRIEKDGEDYMDWDEFIQYFTKRGVPVSVVKAHQLPRLTRVVADVIDKKNHGVNDHKDKDYPIIKVNRAAGYAEGPDPAQFAKEGAKNADFMGYAKQQGGGTQLQDPRDMEKTQLLRMNNNDKNKPVGQVDLLAQTNPNFMDEDFKNLRPKLSLDLEPAVNNNYLDKAPATGGGIYTQEDLLEEQRLLGVSTSKKQPQPHQKQQSSQQINQSSLQQYQSNTLRPPDASHSRVNQNENLSGRSMGTDLANEDDIETEDDFVEYGNEFKKITVPELTGYQEREQNREKKETIQSKKFKDWMKEKEDRDESEINYQFRARDVPKKVKEPLYDKLIYEQELRREEVKKSSIAITRANEKPFSFYERDKSKQKKVKNDYSFKPKQFKAKEMPWFCSVELYSQEMEKAEQLRKEKINRRAQSMLAQAKLPPRMEKHQQEKRQRELLGAHPANMEWEDEFTFHPKGVKPVPNFEKAHKKFQKMLDKKRAYKKPTKIKEFNFSSTKRVPDIDYLRAENDQKLREYVAEQDAIKYKNKKNLEKMRRWKKQGKEYKLSTTKKFTAQVKRNKEERLKRRSVQNKKENDRKEKAKNLKLKAKKFRAALAAEEAMKNKDRPKVNAVKGKRKKRDEDAEQYKNKLDQMNKKLEDRPYSFQRFDHNTKKELKLRQMKTLLTMHDRAIKNKVKNWRDQFSRDEINMIEDAKILRKMGKLDV